MSAKTKVPTTLSSSVNIITDTFGDGVNSQLDQCDRISRKDDYRFNPSHRNLKGLLKRRGIEVSRESIPL